MRATWFLTEDGKTVDPAECGRKDGALTHSGGAKIAMRSPGVPRSRGVDLDESGKLLFGGKGDHDDDGTTGGAKQPDPVKEPEPEKPADPPAEPPVKTTEMKPEPAPAPAKQPAYKRRG